MDVDEWCRAVAFLSLINGSDIYTYGNQHNFIMYNRPEDNKMMAFLWDMDFSFVSDTSTAFPGSGSANTFKMITTIPHHYRLYWNHLYDLTSFTGNSAYLTEWANRYAGMVGENWAAAVTHLVTRAAFVRGQLPTNAPFNIANNGGNNFAISNSSLVITGTAPISVRSVEINGLTYPITWINMTNWVATVPLSSYTNNIFVQAYDSQGKLMTNVTDSIVVTNLATPALLPVLINEWIADNASPGGFPDPVDGQYQDWIELFNPNNSPVNLSGYFLTDNLGVPDKWTIPTNTFIAPLGFLLVWADDDAQNGSNSDLHAEFKLSNTGESLGLFAPNGTPQHALTFTNQVQNVSQGFYPDGNTNTLYSMPNWTPRAPNQIGAPGAPGVAQFVVTNGNTVSFTTTALAGRAYRIDYKNDLSALSWTALSTNRAASASLTIVDPAGAGVPQRFYRIVLLQ
jgi:hypothetical protein